MADAIGEMGIGPGKVPCQPLAVGIDQELVRIEAMSGLRLVGTVNAIAIELSGSRLRQVAMPDVFRAFRQRDAFNFPPAARFEQAKLDLFGVGRKQCEIGPGSVPGGSERMRRTRR